MIKVSLADMLGHVDSQYRLLRVASLRAKQLAHGARPRVEDTEGLKATTIALREIAQGEVEYTVGAPPLPEPTVETGTDTSGDAA